MIRIPRRARSVACVAVRLRDPSAITATLGGARRRSSRSSSCATGIGCASPDRFNAPYGRHTAPVSATTSARLANGISPPMPRSATSRCWKTDRGRKRKYGRSSTSATRRLVIEIDDNLDERRARAGFAAVVMFKAFDGLAALLFVGASKEVRRRIAYSYLTHETHRPPPLFAEKIVVETLRRRDAE